MSSFVSTSAAARDAVVAGYFSDMISAWFDRAASNLRREYDYKYDVRHAYGLDTPLHDEQLEEEWRFKYNKLVKQRNWLWYKMKSNDLMYLDEFFETDFVFERMDLEQRIEFAAWEKSQKEKYKYINRKPSFVPFSQSNLPVEEVSKFDYLFFEEECDLDVKNVKCTYRRKHRSYEALVDNNRVYNKTTVDNRDYNRIYENSMLIRNIISMLESLRQKCRLPAIFKNRRHTNSMIELSEFCRFESNDKPTIVKPPSNLIDRCPCGYCPSITCLVCYRGEGCCICCDYCMKFGVSNRHPTCIRCRRRFGSSRARFEGNVEQDVAGDSNVVQQNRAKNVLLTETEITQFDQAGVSSMKWSPYISNDIVSSFDNMVNRWFTIGTYKWTTQHARGTTLLSLNLPRDAIFAGSSTCNQPNTIPFRIHRYWRGNMRIKVHINCNKFQIGQLQLAWYYQPKADDAFSIRNNIYTRSGTHHTVISAAPNNEVELLIPYHAFKSAFHTKSYSGDNLSLPLDLGTLFVTVLSPLKTTGETSMSCTYSVFVKFEDNEFTGMIAGDVDTPSQVRFVEHDQTVRYEMDTMGTLLPTITSLAERVLTPSANDNNRDNPPDVRPPSYFVPTASHSWANGTNISEPVHNLRLSGTAQTRHPDVALDEMTIESIKRKFMLQKVVQWSQQDNSGKLLFSIPVNPIPPKDQIPVVQNPGVHLLESYQLSPIGFLSSLYQYWRGSIEFRFDFVASQFHSGKLLAAYIPGIAEGEEVTLQQARASPHVVISLDNAMSYTWKVPYVADKPWWPRRYAGESATNNTVSPSKLFLFVLNELVLADTVSDTIDIMVYVRGGEDMEFSVPVQPSIGLGYDRQYISTRDTSQVYPIGSTDTYYYGSWVYSNSGTLVARRAVTSDAYATFSEPILDEPAYYRLYPPAPVPSTPVAIGATTRFNVDHCVFLKTTSQYGGYVCYPIHTQVANEVVSLQILERIARAAFANNYEPGPWMNPYITSGPNTPGFIANSVTTTSNTYGGGTRFPWTATTVSPEVNDYEMVTYQGNREQSFELLDNNRLLASTSSGYMTFGESFTDLKDLCRRWQMYGMSTIPKGNIERDPGACSLLIPLLPQGLSLELNTSTKVNQIWNRAREGHIPLIASLYRYFRGSLRLRIIISNAEGLIAWVQHKPDRVLTRTVITPCDRVSTAEAVFNHTYGVYIQDMSVNRIIELEIPFYQAANYGLLQKPHISSINEWNSFYSLGELSIGFFGETPAQDVRITCYYSIADDMRFNVYQGVPPMILLDDLPEFQGGLSDWFKKKTEAVSDVAIDKVKESLIPEIESTLSNFMSKMSDVATNAKESFQELHLKEKLVSIFGQVAQACANPKPTTIAIAVASILITIGIVTFAMFNTISTYVKQIWNYLTSLVSSNKPLEEGEDTSAARFEDENTKNALTGFFTLICGGLCTLFGLKKDIQHGLTSDKLFANIDKGMKMSNVCFVFMRNILSVIGDLKTKIISFLYPAYDIAQAMVEGRDVIERWSEASLYLVDPTIARNIRYSIDLQNSFYDCFAMGKILKVKSLELQYPSLIQYVNSIYQELKKVAIDLTAQGIDPIVRKLPFTIYNVGEPGIGKSHLTTNLCSELCKAEEIKSDTGLLCVLNSSSKFWDHCDRQPCLVIDDVFNIKKGQMLEDQIATIFNVVTPVPLLPPKAAVEDKGRPYNPEIFVMNSNVAFFKTELCDLQALYRRRDIIIFTELDPDFKKEGCKHCENNLKVSDALGAEGIAMLSDNHHLRFKYTFDVKNENCVKYPTEGYLKYNELLTVLKKAFHENRRDENIRFAQRVQDNMVICGTRKSVVGSVMNLEQEWNDAIAKRRLRQEFYQNQTWKLLASEFKVRMSERCDTLKHEVLRKIYNFCRPFHNKYAMKNDMCAECCRIKYQCGVCKTKMLKLMTEPNEDVTASTSQPSPSSGSSIEIIPPEVEQGIDAYVEEQMKTRYQSGDEEVIPRSFNVDFILPESTKKWLKDLGASLGDEEFESFDKFLRDHNQLIAFRLGRYPTCSRTVVVFKHCCEVVSKALNTRERMCIHDLDINPPQWTSKHGIFFINPQNPGLPCKLNEGYECTTGCLLQLPWRLDRLVKYCKDKKYPVEGWMGEGNMLVPSSKVFDDIFGNLVKWIWNFYYDKLKPAAKAVYCFFSSFTGFITGLSIIGLLFSTVATGCAIVHTVKATKSLDADLHDKQQNYLETGRYNTNNSPKSSPKVDVPPPFNPYMNPTPSTSTSAIKYQSKSYDGVRPKVAKIKRPRVPSKPQFESAQQFQVVENLLNKNLVMIVAITKCEEGMKKYEAACLMLRGQEMLFEKHYLTTWQNQPVTTKYYLQCPLTVTERTPLGLEFNLHDCPVQFYGDHNAEYDDTNFCIMSLPLTVPAFKDITKFIAKSVEHQYIDMSNCWLYDNKLRRSRHCNMHLRSTEITDGSNWLRIDQCYSYQYTEIGMCGSILMCASLERPIIGMHFGGTGAVGFAEPMCAEMFKKCEDEREYKYETFEMETDDEEEPKITLRTLLYPQGQVPKEHTATQGDRSQYIPSKVFDTYKNDCEPNPLSPSDRRLPKGSHPLRDGCEFMGMPPKDFPSYLINPAAEHLRDTVMRTVKPIRPKVDLVSLQDAVCGNKNVEGFEPLEWSTSEGFPLKSIRPKGVSGKRWLFDLEETEDGYKLKGMHGELRRQLYLGKKLRKNKIECPTVFTDCLKDTVVPVEKCSIPGKTRIFSISPVQYTIMFKQYFGDFLASYTKARLDCEHGIGINCDSIEWTMLAEKLTAKGDKIIAGDYKNFGPSLMLKCVKKCFDIIMDWYECYDPDDERQTIRRVLLAEILHARHLCTNVLYTVPCGIPSGSPITAPLNSLVNCLYLRCAWLKITSEPFTVFDENVNIVVYGDDVCINISDKYCDIYNTSSLNLFFKDYDIVFTDVDKSDNIIPYKTLDEVTFLKRGFKRHPHHKFYFLAPIEVRSIYKCTNWITRKGDATSNTLENCVQACELAFGHGPQFYNEVKATLMKACNERLGVSFMAPSWSEKSERCFNIG